MLGKGRAEAISPAHMAALADEINCHPADLEAIAKVESGGFGWDKKGRIKILFEKHWFYKFLTGDKRRKAVSRDLARRKWISPKRGGYREQNTSDRKYRILEQAMQMDENAALQSISMGTYQIMGFNYRKAGFRTVHDMWDKFRDSEVHQLQGFRNVLIAFGLKQALRDGDFDAVETAYNGGGLNGVYARRMRTAARNLRKGKWKNYRPGSMPILDKPQQTTPAKQAIEDATVLSTGAEKTGAGLGAGAAAVGLGLATAWNNGLWVLVSVAGAGLAAFIIWRVVKRK